MLRHSLGGSWVALKAFERFARLKPLALDLARAGTSIDLGRIGLALWLTHAGIFAKDLIWRALELGGVALMFALRILTLVKFSKPSSLEDLRRLNTSPDLTHTGVFMDLMHAEIFAKDFIRCALLWHGGLLGAFRLWFAKTALSIAGYNFQRGLAWLKIRFYNA